MEIVSALDSSSVTRLKKSWKLVPKKDLKKLNLCKAAVSGDYNSSNLREVVSELEINNLPCIPYIGLILFFLNFFL